MNIKYKIVGYCSDCTGCDPMGCNDGEPFDLGYAETIEEAKIAGKSHADECSPYYSEIFDTDGELIETVK